MKKDTTYLLRLSKERKAAYETLAKKANMNLAAWIAKKLDAADNHIPATVQVPKTTSAEELKQAYEKGKVDGWCERENTDKQARAAFKQVDNLTTGKKVTVIAHKEKPLHERIQAESDAQVKAIAKLKTLPKVALPKPSAKTETAKIKNDLREQLKPKVEMNGKKPFVCLLKNK